MHYVCNNIEALKRFRGKIHGVGCWQALRYRRPPQREHHLAWLPLAGLGPMQDVVISPGRASTGESASLANDI